MVNSSHCMYKEEEGRRIAAMEAFQVAEKSNHDLKAKLIEAEKEKKKVPQLPWITLRGRPKASGFFSTMPRIN